jgi:ATP-dependent Clp protease ATP-binding subunit ClpA
VISKELELCLHSAFVDARNKRHEHVSTEHLLLAILGEQSIATSVLRSCGVDVDGLQSQLATVVEKTPVSNKDPETQPTSEFQRVMQRAIKNAQSFHTATGGPDISQRRGGGSGHSP